MRQSEKRPCLDKGKDIIIEVEDDGQTRKAIGESQKEGISVESRRKRKGTVDAPDNVSISSLKSRRRMEMGKFLENPFTSCQIIDLEFAKTDSCTRPVTTAYAKHENADPTPRNNAKATGESSLPGGVEHKGPDKKSSTGTNPRVRNMSNMTAPYISRPIGPINQVCILNRNPKDFSTPDLENIYMI
ncbi:hypothetical protein POM88_033850 [Heracleum sosnowskyi]|uniref:Uncharacterized protein n=1 Tax=Heracleum sosnowskyi TaxID=360622 RepID=A0AAD8MD09_9APIA|nr:hypothetical protein POM88_033850 [Heracleum sosnowskyi]